MSSFWAIVMLALIVAWFATRRRLKSASATNARRTPSSRPSTQSQGVSLASKSSEQAREAWLSGDLQRMINALESKAKLLDRHFLLMAVVNETYRRRSDPAMSKKCLEVAQLHIKEFPRIRSALKSEYGDPLPRVTTFQQYATLLAERREFDRAVEVCESAIAFGLHDGTKSGFEGRIARIRKKAASTAQEKTASTELARNSTSTEITTTREASKPREEFSEAHRRRRRRIKPKTLDLDGVPFVSLPRAPRQWDERDAEDARKEDEGAEEFFELFVDPSWDLSSPAKVRMDERPDPAFRLHFSARSGTFLIDDLGKTEAHSGAPSAVLSFGPSGTRIAGRGLAWDVYRRQVNPLGRGLIAVSSDQVLHCYDEELHTLVALPLTDTPELRAAKSRLGIGDHEMHRHIRAVALRPDGHAYLFSVVDEAFAVDIDARPIWGVRMPQQEGWERVGTMTSQAGTRADVHEALEILSLSYPFAVEDVKRQYRELAKRWHPDKNPGRERESAVQFRRVVDAAELLSGLDMSDFAAPAERAIYRKVVGEPQEFEIEGTGITVSLEMSFGGDERSVADWIYAASFGASGGAFLAGYSGKVVEIDASGRPVRLFDTGSVPRRIADTGDYLYFLTDARLYVIRGTRLSNIVDVFRKGELVVGETGFGLLNRKAFRWYTEEGHFVGGIRTKHPLRRIYPTGKGWNVETRQHRAEVRGVPAWLEQ